MATNDGTRVTTEEGPVKGIVEDNVCVFKGIPMPSRPWATCGGEGPRMSITGKRS